MGGASVGNSQRASLVAFNWTILKQNKTKQGDPFKTSPKNWNQGCLQEISWKSLFEQDLRPSHPICQPASPSQRYCPVPVTICRCWLLQFHTDKFTSHLPFVKFTSTGRSCRSIQGQSWWVDFLDHLRVILHQHAMPIQCFWSSSYLPILCEGEGVRVILQRGLCQSSLYSSALVDEFQFSWWAQIILIPSLCGWC